MTDSRRSSTSLEAAAAASRIPTPPGRSRGSLLELSPSRWRDALHSVVDAPYRAEQIAGWVYRKGTFELGEMTDLPEALREELATSLTVEPPPVHRAFTSVDGTRRYLLRLGDDRLVEAVSMPYDERVTLCVSSQVGCRFGCTFCQTGRMGLVRDLTAGEIVGQVVRLRATEGRLERPVNVVFMGQGEPLDNPEGVRAAVEALQDPVGADLSWRRITISTVGVVPQLRALAELGDRRPRIAVSLNAVDDATRSQIMPIDRKYPIRELLEALAGLTWRPRERVTFEYVLLAGINDGVDAAETLARRLEGLPAKVNLIPWNPIPDADYRRPSPEAVEAFRRTASARGLDVLVRYSRGADIAAACGQLHADAGEQARSGPLG